MAVHSVYISSRILDGMALDTELRKRFADVYRVGLEFWLVDADGDAEVVVSALRPVLSPVDKIFVGALSRDVVPVLSRAAHAWLNAPDRSWAKRAPGAGSQGTQESPFAPLSDHPFAVKRPNPFSVAA